MAIQHLMVMVDTMATQVTVHMVISLTGTMVLDPAFMAGMVVGGMGGEAMAGIEAKTYTAILNGNMMPPVKVTQAFFYFFG